MWRELLDRGLRYGISHRFSRRAAYGVSLLLHARWTLLSLQRHAPSTRLPRQCRDGLGRNPGSDRPRRAREITISVAVESKGSYSGTLAITDNASGTPQMVSVTGTVP